MIHRRGIGRPGRMARHFDGTTDYVGKTSAIVSGVPLTISAWFMSYSATAQQYVGCVTNYAGGASGDFHALSIRGDVAGDPLRAISYQSGISSQYADTTGGYTAGQWHHGVAVFATNTDRRIYLDYVDKGTDTGSSTPGSLSRTCIGELWRSDNPSLFFDGMICDVAWWAAALEDGEILDLYMGKLPSKIRPGYLLAWHRMSSPSFGDLDWSRQGFDMETQAGAPTWGGGPPLHLGTHDNRLRLLDEYKTVVKVGKARFFGTVLGSGVTTAAHEGMMLDPDGNLKVSGQVYEGSA